MGILTGANAVAQDYAKPGKLMDKTQKLLINDKRCILDIHKETGIPFYWLRSFKQREVKNPSVNTVEKLYVFLTGNEISL